MYRLLNSTFSTCHKQQQILNLLFKSSWHVNHQTFCNAVNTDVPSLYRKLPDFLVATEFVADVLIDGVPLASHRDEVQQIGIQLQSDGAEIVKQAMIWQHEKIGVKGPIKSMIELSVVLCNEGEIKKLNKKYREIDSATDVLSFRMFNEDEIEGMPMVALGDVLICVPVALLQAQQRRYDLLDEIRVLLVHGVLHLLGYDHDRNDEEWDLMSEAEQFIIQGLGWKGQGLIEAQGSVPIHQVPDAAAAEQKAHTVRIPLKKFMR